VDNPVDPLQIAAASGWLHKGLRAGALLWSIVNREVQSST
jgi:hypothetical protein